MCYHCLSPDKRILCLAHISSLFFLCSGATKVTACGKTLTRSSKTAPGAPGANTAPARAPVELEFASAHVSATTQRKWQLHELILWGIVNHCQVKSSNYFLCSPISQITKTLNGEKKEETSEERSLSQDKEEIVVLCAQKRTIIDYKHKTDVVC